MNPFMRVVAALNRSGVRYVIVGGFAAYLHGTRRLTVDLDLVIDLRANEARRAIEALLALDLKPRLPVDPLQFADAEIRTGWIRDKHMTVFTMFDPATPGFVVDLFAESPGDFEALYAAAVNIELDAQPARLCAIDDLIAMKLAAGRPQDLLDVNTLREIKSIKDGS